MRGTSAARAAGFRAILELQPDLNVVGEAVDGRDAVEFARRRRPDVVLMDIKMPDLDGLEATRRILADAQGATAVLILTTFDLDEYVYEALRVGASGFLLKDAPPEQLIAAIHTLAAGEALIAPAITKRLIEQFARVAPRSAPSAALEELTAREREVLVLIARGLSNRETVRAEATSLEFSSQLRKEPPVVADGPGSDAINAGRPCALVGLDPVPRNNEERRVIDEVVQVIKPAVRVADRPSVQLRLHRPYPPLSLIETGPRRADIHRRPSRSAWMPRSCWTPSPCSRLSRPRTTTGPPSHPGGVSRRRAFPPTSPRADR